MSALPPGELARRAAEAVSRLTRCEICPRRCGVNRLAGELGFCGVGRRARVVSWNLHYGEEAVLVGQGGSGTVFFAGCNLGCCFCQNADIAFDPAGSPALEAGNLAAIFLELQDQGAANCNLVTPSHVVPQILEALAVAAQAGFRLPVVYNTSAYDSLETLALLDGVVDVYLPDAKFADPAVAQRFCRAPDYPAVARAAIAEMHRQVGDLAVDEAGLAMSGLLVRHLALPEDLAGTAAWAPFLAGLSPDVYVNVMDQYRPCHDAYRHPGLDRAVTGLEVERARELALAAGLRRLDDAGAGFTLKKVLALLAKRDKAC